MSTNDWEPDPDIETAKRFEVSRWKTCPPYSSFVVEYC